VLRLIIDRTHSLEIAISAEWMPLDPALAMLDRVIEEFKARRVAASRSPPWLSNSIELAFHLWGLDFIEFGGRERPSASAEMHVMDYLVTERFPAAFIGPPFFILSGNRMQHRASGRLHYDVHVRERRPGVLASLPQRKGVEERRAELVRSVWVKAGRPEWTHKEAFEAAREAHPGHELLNCSVAVQRRCWQEAKKLPPE
jgi:hypothetical protein